MRTWPAIDVAAGFSSPDGDLLQAALLDHDVTAVDEDAGRVFFTTTEARAGAVDALRRQFPNVRLALVDVPDEDWAARSQANLTPVQVGGITVAPPWAASRDVAELKGGILVVIQPSTGFGTGHHATTRLCLAHLQQLDLRGRAVLDVGTGSGVLAIAASRLGASQTLAVDDDPDAVAAARENLALNPGTNVSLGTLDLRQLVLRPFDLVVGNLTGGLLISSADALQRLASPGGHLVLSGFLHAEEPDVIAAFASCTINERSQEDEWVCVTFSRSR